MEVKRIEFKTSAVVDSGKKSMLRIFRMPRRWSDKYLNILLIVEKKLPKKGFGNSGDTILRPDFLLSQDNIFVKIEYRVGIFGFFHLDFTEYTGNMGLKDQQLALKWIYENIEDFSGNKHQILLFGQSTGSSPSFCFYNPVGNCNFGRRVTRLALDLIKIIKYYPRYKKKN